MSVSYWMNNKETIKNISCDVLIVGGGIAGLSAAYWLNHEDPNLNIAIVEKNELGEGATGRNAGFITCGSVEHFNRIVTKHGISEAQEIWKFSEDNLELLKEHILNGPDKSLIDFENIGFENKGSFSLASVENEFDELKKSAKIMDQLKIDVEVLNQAEIKKRLHSEGFVGGIKYLGDASVHPLKLLMTIKNKLHSQSHSKIKFYENSEVINIESQDGNKIIRTKKYNFESSIVILATNGYSSLLHSYFIDKIFPTRGQILVTEPLPHLLEGPCYANFVLDYFRQLPTGEMLIGGFRQLQKDSETGYSDQTTDVIQRALEEFLNKHLPFVRNAKITHRWSGIMGFSVDGQPLVGCIPNDPQIYFLGGFTGHGLGLAFHCGKKLVDMMYDRPIPKFLSAKRFQI